jgi:hypothetical protein
MPVRLYDDRLVLFHLIRCKAVAIARWNGVGTLSFLVLLK